VPLLEVAAFSGGRMVPIAPFAFLLVAILAFASPGGLVCHHRACRQNSTDNKR
jgi:hypothetical protein